MQICCFPEKAMSGTWQSELYVGPRRFECNGNHLNTPLLGSEQGKHSTEFPVIRSASV